jgi:hypothetical protein
VLSLALPHKSDHRLLFPAVRASNSRCNAERTLRASTDPSGHDRTYLVLAFDALGPIPQNPRAHNGDAENRLQTMLVELL